MLRVKPPTFHQTGLAPRFAPKPPAQQRSFLTRILMGIPKWAWENKFKTIFMIIAAIVAHKLWTLYKTYVRPFLDIAKSLKGDPKLANPDPAADNQPAADVISSGSEYYQEVFEEEELETPQIEEIDESRPLKVPPKRRKRVPNKKSIKFINRIASSSEDEKMRINVFQSTMGMTRKGLKLQTEFIANFCTQDIFQLEAKHTNMIGKHASNQEKVAVYKDYKCTVLKSLFSSVVATRVSNVVSLITLLQTGKRFFKNSQMLKAQGDEPKEEGGEDKADQVMNKLMKEMGPGSLIGGGGTSGEKEWEGQKQSILSEINGTFDGAQRMLDPRCPEDKDLQTQKCESFSRDLLSMIIKPFIEEELCPLVARAVQGIANQVKLAIDFRKEEFSAMMRLMHRQVLAQVFFVDQKRVKAYNKFVEEELDSEDSLDLEFAPEMPEEYEESENRHGLQKETKPIQPWIIERIISLIEKEIPKLIREQAPAQPPNQQQQSEEERMQNQQKLRGSILTRALSMELMDILETDYFKTTLFEAIDEGFKQVILEFLPELIFDQEPQQQEENGSIDVGLKEVKPVKFMQIIMVMTSFMSTSESSGTKESSMTSALNDSLLPPPSLKKKSAQSLNQMIKYVFFDDDKQAVYQRVTLEDLESFTEKQLEQANGGDDGLVNQLLSSLMGSGGGEGGDQGLMNMLGSLMKEDKAGEVDGEALENSNIDEMIRQLAKKQS